MDHQPLNHLATPRPAEHTKRFVLTLSCEDRPGVVASVTTELASTGANIAESNQFWDRQTNRFFMRIAFTAAEGTTKDDVERGLKPAIER
ncbi:MAG: ACT domain-containing protein, partial [Phyllobacterium sp.]|uniref:ACT domain-containing protein n=1 Tax=Phyllobacterium sp. TaxID=1871046 RepID=UPI0030F26F86